MTITTRSGKGSALTNTELDANFTHLGGDGSYQAPSTKGTAGQVLRMNSGATALEFGTVSGGGGMSDLVDDTTPQLGGALDTNGNNITFSDNTKARFGAGNDLEIYHDATDNHIDYSSKLTFTPSGGADLSFNGSSYDTDWMALGHWHFKDGTQARFGNADDLTITHDGSNSYVTESGTGSLIIKSSFIDIKDASNVELISADATEVRLRQGGNIKLTTTSSGIRTTGTVNVNNAYTLPTADGTNGQVLTTDGAGAVTFATPSGGGGGVTGFASADNTSSPNNTTNVASLSVNSSSTNAGAAIVPKGTGAFMLGIPDSGTTGGNVRGASAVDLGIYRTNANQVASGTESILLGNRMRASGTEAIAIGKNSYANGTRSMAVGYDSNTSASDSINMMAGGSGSPAQYGVVIGPGSKCGTRGFSVSRGRSVTSHAFSRGGNVQPLQTTYCEYWGRTTDATTATISSEGLNQSSSEAHFLELVPGGLYFYTQNFAYMTAKVIANDSTNNLLRVWDLSAAWKIASSDGAVTQAGTTTKTVIHSEGSALNSTDVDTTITSRRLVLNVTGVASTNIHWTAWIKLHMNRYA